MYHPTNHTMGKDLASNKTTVFIYGLGEAIAQTFILGVIIIFGLTGNFYICSVVYKTKNLRNPTFVFLANLAVANIGALTLCTPFPLVNSIKRRFVLGNQWCLVNAFLNNFFFCVSIFTLSLIATQNFFTVVKPPYCEWLQITKKRVKYHVAGIWTLCFAFSLLALGPFEQWNYAAFNPTTAHCGIAFPDTVGDKFKLAVLALVAFIIPIGWMSYAYGRIYLKVRFHEVKVNRSKKANKCSAVTKKLAVTLCLMFGTFVVCWFPFFLLVTMAIFLDDVSKLPWTLGRFAYWSGYLNCAINPPLYCLRSSTFKDVIRRRSSTSVEATANKSSAPRMTRRRAFSLPVISANLKRPLLRIERQSRQSYPKTGQEVSMPGLWESEEILQNARLRGYSCSSFGIRESEDFQEPRSEKTAREQGDGSKWHNSTDESGNLALNDITIQVTDRIFSQICDRNTMSGSAVKLRGNSPGQPSAKIMSIGRLEEMTTHV